MVSKEVAKGVVINAIVQGVKEASKDPSNDLKPADIKDVASTVIDKVTPALEHVTNTENWWQSRAVWGQIIATGSLLIGPIIGHQFSADEQLAITNLCVASGVVVGAGLTLYSRYFAKKPLFTKKE